MLLEVWLRDDVLPVLPKPAKFRARRRGRMVIREAAVMATAGSTSVQSMAVVPVTLESVTG
jgi:hypothetical protein